MADVNGPEEIIGGRLFVSAPNIPASRVSLWRVTKAIDGLLSKRFQRQSKFQMNFARKERHTKAVTHGCLPHVHGRSLASGVMSAMGGKRTLGDGSE